MNVYTFEIYQIELWKYAQVKRNKSSTLKHLDCKWLTV